ncbi:hypothetical protein LWI28_018747 [Acer negundo]|uniref:Uncharacterized protein n=1 Tax=Acer negundo TaxID=4023 RepID=A0AAD5IEZ9_ACENE|nr:hypothetical protein LWI28_018747 [Acer negundo]
MNPNAWLLEIPSITQVTDTKILRQMSQLRLFKPTGTAPSRQHRSTLHNKNKYQGIEVHHCLVDNLRPKFIARNVVGDKQL